MIQWDRKKFRKNLVRQILTMQGLMLLVSLGYQFQKSYAKKAEPFIVENRYVVGLKEISGLTVHPGTQGQQLTFITDRKAGLLSYTLPKGQSIKQNFDQLVFERFSLCQDPNFRECAEQNRKLAANWEALSRDATGRLFALQEHTQSLFVLNPKLDRIDKIIQFNLAESLDPAWNRGTYKFSSNSLAEGLILLKNGHMLIAKEKNPLVFVEFGPKGSTPLGLNKDTILAADEAFALPQSSDLRVYYEALATWPLTAHSKCDISDLAIDSEGQLLALSETCRQIAVFSELKLGAKAEIKEYLALPSEIKAPEALAVAGDKWFVASDLANKREYNFYILKRSPAIE